MLKEVVRAFAEEVVEELTPLKEALSADGMEDHVEVLESVIGKIATLKRVLDNSDLDAKIG